MLGNVTELQALANSLEPAFQEALVGRILQAVGPDVIPDLLDDLGAGQGALPTVAANSVDSVRQVRRVAAKLSAR